MDDRRSKLIKVQATRMGQYNNRMYEKGEIFFVDESFFADANHSEPKYKKFGWMIKVS